MNREKEIIKLRRQGLSWQNIANQFKISRQRAAQIGSGYSTNHLSYRKDVFERDNYTCQWCGLKSFPIKIKPEFSFQKSEVKIENLVVHHIDFNDRNLLPKNLITLCVRCHSSFHATNHINKKILKNLSGNKPKKTYKCKICGKEFYGHRKTCSQECYKESMINRNSKLFGMTEEQKRERHNKIMLQRYYNEVKNNPKELEIRKLYGLKYLREHRQEINKKISERYYANLEENRRKNREYYHKNKERINKNHRNYYKKNK